MLDAIRRSIHKKDGDTLEATAHIMGSRDKGSGTFITRFFEGGTKVRVSKKKKNRGKIMSYNFFSSAVKTTNEQIDKLLMDSILETINNINGQS